MQSESPEKIQPRAGRSVVALCGGVGGAKLALGLSKALAVDELTIVGNTADDLEHLGLPISPDLDTVMYTLAGRNNPEQGWGLVEESWQAMAMLRDYGAETWFQLGDRDIATHLLRRQYLAEGYSLTETTARLCRALGVAHRLLPMTDAPVQTRVRTTEGDLSFQHYFVRERCEPRVTRFYFDGIDTAQPQAEFMAALASPNTDAVIVCPSNPFVSIQPILALPGVEKALQTIEAPVIAVSPIVAGAAIKGPTAKMMKELGMPASALAVAEFYTEKYAGVIDAYVLDEADADYSGPVRELGLEVTTAPTIMHTLDDRIELAKRVLAFADILRSEKSQAEGLV